jgi:hypothetical protein
MIPRYSALSIVNEDFFEKNGDAGYKVSGFQNASSRLIEFSMEEQVLCPETPC